MSLLHVIHNIPLLRIFFSNVAVNKLNAGRCLVLNFIHIQAVSHDHNERSGVQAKNTSLLALIQQYYIIGDLNP